MILAFLVLLLVCGSGTGTDINASPTMLNMRLAAAIANSAHSWTPRGAHNMAEDHASPNSEQIDSIIETARKAWLEGNADNFAGLFTASGQVIVPGQRWTGPDEIRAALNDYDEQFSVVSIEIQRKLIAGNQAAVEWSWHEMERETGCHRRADDVIMIEFEGIQIERWREYIDTKTPSS